MRARMLILSSCVTIFLVGCGSPLVKPTITDTYTYDASFNDVWSATVQTFAERSLPVSALEKDSGFITTQSHIIDYGIFSESTLEAIAAHPDIFAGIWESPKLSVNAFISSEGPNRTRVKVNTHIEAFEKNMMGKWYICYSKGVIEKNILDTIQSKLDTMPQKISGEAEATSAGVPATSADANRPQRKIIGYRVDTSRRGPDGGFLTIPVYEDEKK